MTKLPNGVSLTVENTDYSTDVNELVHSTETPGGLRECRFSLDSKLGRRIGWDDRLVIYDSAHAAWPFVGRISNIRKTGLCFEFTAIRSTRLRKMKSTTGPGNPSHPSGVYAGRIYKAGTLMETTLRDALQLCEAAVFDGGISSLSGLQYIADTNNMAGYTAEQMWDYVAALLTGFSTPLEWHVRGSGGLQIVKIDFQDPAARYLVQLPEEQIEEEYDSEQAITTAAVEYGNDQVYEQSITPLAAGRRLFRDKYVNGSRDLTRLQAAQGLAGAYIARFGQPGFRSTGGQLTLKCDENIVQAKPPVASSNNWPLWLIESGHGCQLLGRSPLLAPYNENLKYIIGTEYVWDTGVLTARTGIAGGGLDSRIQQTVDYNVNRLFFGPYNGPPGASQPLADADLLPQIGSEMSPTLSTSYGIPGFKDSISPGDPNVPYDKQLDPDIVPDEGLEANVNFDPAAEGFQAAIRTTPGTYVEYRLLLGNETGLVADTVVAEFYRVIPPSENLGGGQQFLFKIQSDGTKDRTLPLTTPVILKRGDYAMIKVTTTGASATWAAVSLHAKKNFPRLKS